MKQRRRAFFLPVILAAGLLLGSCNTPVTPEPPVVVTYGVTFDANGGSGTMEPIIGVTDEYVLPECSFTAPTGKRFTGWKVDGQGDLLKPGAKINLTANIKLVAQWELIKYTVSFDANGGTGTIASVTDVLGEYTLPSSSFTAPEGHHFVGWKVNGEGELLQPGAKINVDANVRIVAQWDGNIYTVTFKNGEQVLETAQVKYGEKATYSGETPTQAAAQGASKCVFRGWDKNIDDPITGDTVFNAVFANYADEIVIDNFEKYEETADLIEDGKWKPVAWGNGGWTEETKASVSLSCNATQGHKAMRFDAWANNNDYKFKKTFAANQFPLVANTLKFSLMVPYYKNATTVKLLLFANAPINGEMMEVQFNYTLDINTNQYVDYSIPLNDANWAAWGEQGKTIKVLANAVGLSEDDIIKTMTKVEMYLKINDGANGQPYVAFFDDFKFVTVDNPVASQVEKMGSYNKYTGIAASGKTIKLDIGAQGAATATVLDEKNQPQIPGTISVNDKEVTFTSADSGASLIYKGKLVNGGQIIEGISAEGTYKEIVGTMNLSAVQTLDNFDQYTSEGKTWYITIDQETKAVTEYFERSGARGQYYAEYYAGERSTEFGGGGWSYMQGGEQIKLKTDGGHSGQNYLCLKSSLYNAMRYMQFGLIDGTAERNSYRGAKLSFWVKTNGRVPALKVYMYSQTGPRNATKDTSVRTGEYFNDAAIGEWTHYEIALNEALTYYGFAILMENHYKYDSCPDSYLYIDDIEVYTASPYVTYVEPNN